MSTRKDHIQRTARAGEGVQIAIVRQIGATTDSHHQIQIDLRSAPVPDRRYTADVVCLTQSNGVVRFLFGQTRVDGIQLRSLLDVHFSLLAASRLSKTMDDLKISFELLKQQGMKLGTLIDITDEPNQTIGLTANIVMASCSGEESALDFYHMSPFSVVEVQKGGGLFADPVVRVILPTSLLMALVDKLDQIKDSLPESDVVKTKL